MAKKNKRTITRLEKKPGINEWDDNVAPPPIESDSNYTFRSLDPLTYRATHEAPHVDHYSMATGLYGHQESAHRPVNIEIDVREREQGDNVNVREVIPNRQRPVVSRMVDRPINTEPLNDRPSRNFGNQHYAYTRDDTGPVPYAQDGSHFSAATHRRNYDIYQMEPARVTRAMDIPMAMDKTTRPVTDTVARAVGDREEIPIVVEKIRRY